MGLPKKIGFIEYRDEFYIHEIMKEVQRKTQYKAEFLKHRNLNFRNIENYSVIYDMISPFNRFLAEVMKVYYLNGTYIINNPFSISQYNKILQLHKLNEMRIPIPHSIVLPNHSDESEAGVLGKPEFNEIFSNFEFPFVIKPYDGYANGDVFAINSKKELYKIYKEKKHRIMIVQEAIHPHDYYRVFSVNKNNINFVKRKPRIIEAKNFDFCNFEALTNNLQRFITKKTIQINKSMGYDISTIEWAITEDGKAYVIDVNDAPNIADPKKAKKMDLHFPEETYKDLVRQISELIVEKAEMESCKRQIQINKGFNLISQSLFSKIRKNFSKNIPF